MAAVAEHTLTVAGGQALEVWCCSAAVTHVKYPYGVHSLHCTASITAWMCQGWGPAQDVQVARLSLLQV